MKPIDWGFDLADVFTGGFPFSAPDCKILKLSVLLEPVILLLELPKEGVLRTVGFTAFLVFFSTSEFFRGLAEAGSKLIFGRNSSGST